MTVLSVVIVTYQSATFIDDCLTSLLESTGVDLDVIVVDNDSPDGTADLVEARYPSVRVVRSGGNFGFATATNMGLRIRRSVDVLVLNPDTVVPAGALGAALDELGRRPGVGILGVKLVRPDGRFDHAAKRSLPTPARTLGYFSHLDRRPPWSRRFGTYTAAHLSPDEAGPVDAVNGAFMLIRGGVLDECGGFDERFWMYGEDIDLCRRAADAGWTVLYWPGQTVVHLKGASSPGGRDARVRRAFFDAMALYWEKYHPGAGRGARLAVRGGARAFEATTVAMDRIGRLRRGRGGTEGER